MKERAGDMPAGNEDAVRLYFEHHHDEFLDLGGETTLFLGT